MPYLRCDAWQYLAHRGKHHRKVIRLLVRGHGNGYIKRPRFALQLRKSEIFRLVRRQSLRGDEDACVQSILLPFVDDCAITSFKHTRVLAHQLQAARRSLALKKVVVKFCAENFVEFFKMRE